MTALGVRPLQTNEALEVDRFDQSGEIADLYRAYRLDAEAILDATAAALAT
jgi:pyruvate dehydrogenase E1 component